MDDFALILGLWSFGCLFSAAVLRGSVAAWRRLDDRTERRRANPSVRHGLMLVASGSMGALLLCIREVLMLLTASRWAWFLLYADPDSLGRYGFALSLYVCAGGVCLLLRGLLAVLFEGSPGRLPWLLGRGSLRGPG